MQPKGLRQKISRPVIPQSLSSVLVHLIFSTKNREPLIGPECREPLLKYLAGTLNAVRCPAIIVGGVADHVHALFVLARTMSISDVIEELKKESSKWAKVHVHPAFYWQNGYGAFSVSPILEPKVRQFIALQEQHHQSMTFQDEFRKFLRQYQIEWDERYVWD